MCPAETSLLLLLLSGIKLKQRRNWRKFKDWASNSSKLPPSAWEPHGPCLDLSGRVKQQPFATHAPNHSWILDVGFPVIQLQLNINWQILPTMNRSDQASSYWTVNTPILDPRADCWSPCSVPSLHNHSSNTACSTLYSASECRRCYTIGCEMIPEWITASGRARCSSSASLISN